MALSFPRFCALRVQPGTGRAEEATALRAPGKQRETRERTGLREVFWLGSAGTAATRVTARVGVLAVPTLRPTAQDPIGAAPGHAWGRVVDFTLQRFSEEPVGATIVLTYS